MAGSLEITIPGALMMTEVVGLTLMATVFSRKQFERKIGDLRAARRYFLLFALLLAGLPIVFTALLSPNPGPALAALGLRLGHGKLGLALMAAGLPLAVLAGAVGARDPSLQSFYPFSRSACRDLPTFLGYEARYVLLYYTTWEFCFRGILFFPILETAGWAPALAVQAGLSTLYHLGHPKTEIFAALGAGIVFGLIAGATGSILYSFLIHAAAGVATDAFLYRRRSRLRTAG